MFLIRHTLSKYWSYATFALQFHMYRVLQELLNCQCFLCLVWVFFVSKYNLSCDKSYGSTTLKTISQIWTNCRGNHNGTLKIISWDNSSYLPSSFNLERYFLIVGNKSICSVGNNSVRCWNHYCELKIAPISERSFLLFTVTVNNFCHVAEQPRFAEKFCSETFDTLNCEVGCGCCPFCKQKPEKQDK